MDTDRESTAVIHDANGAVFAQGYINLCAETSERFVNGIVDNLIDQVMQAAYIGRADIHARTLPDSFEAFKNLDLIFSIIIRHLSGFTDLPFHLFGGKLLIGFDCIIFLGSGNRFRSRGVYRFVFFHIAPHILSACRFQAIASSGIPELFSLPRKERRPVVVSTH